MAIDLQKIYDRSPIFLQNLLCSLYGIKLYRERYSGVWLNYLKYLEGTQFLSKDELNNIQLSLLKAILENSIKFVPYYRDQLQLSINDVKSIDAFDVLQKLPVLDKKKLRELSDLFVSTQYKKSSLVKINTSGTTGTPLTIYVSKAARQKNYAFFTRSKQWAGLDNFGHSSVTMAGRTIVPSSQQSPPFWRKNFFLNNTLFSSYHISEKNLQAYVDELIKIKPQFIDSYPSSISCIADYCIINNIFDIRLKGVITSAETLFDHQREKIEKVFGCKVFDQYGSAEQVVFACQCEKGRYHINPEYGFLEVVDRNDNPVANGELGEFVCTGFINDAMPLIRYKIGDMGIVTDKQCECGRNFTVIEKIYGRNDDTLITPDGKYIGRLDPIFKGIKNTIKETQIVQEKRDLINIFVVRTGNYKEEHGNFIVDQLKKRMGGNIQYSIKYVDSIKRTKAGKFRSVICDI